MNLSPYPNAENNIQELKYAGKKTLSLPNISIVNPKAFLYPSDLELALVLRLQWIDPRPDNPGFMYIEVK
jgi:hypothetical protein